MVAAVSDWEWEWAEEEARSGARPRPTGDGGPPSGDGGGGVVPDRAARLARVPVQLELGPPLETKDREQIHRILDAWTRELRMPFSATAIAILRALYQGASFTSSRGYRSHKTIAHDAGLGARLDEIHDPDPKVQATLRAKETERARRLYMIGFRELVDAGLVVRERIPPRDARLDRCPHKARAILRGRRWALPAPGTCRCPWFHGAVRWAIVARTPQMLLDAARRAVETGGWRLRRASIRKHTKQNDVSGGAGARMDVISNSFEITSIREGFRSEVCDERVSQITSISVSTTSPKSGTDLLLLSLEGDLCRTKSMPPSGAPRPMGESPPAVHAASETRAPRGPDAVDGPTPRPVSNVTDLFAPRAERPIGIVEAPVLNTSTLNAPVRSTLEQAPLERAGASPELRRQAFQVLEAYRRVFMSDFLGFAPMPYELDAICDRLEDGYTVGQLSLAVAQAACTKHNAQGRQRTLRAIMTPAAVESLVQLACALKTTFRGKETSAAPPAPPPATASETPPPAAQAPRGDVRASSDVALPAVVPPERPAPSGSRLRAAAPIGDPNGWVRSPSPDASGGAISPAGEVARLRERMYAALGDGDFVEGHRLALLIEGLARNGKP